MKKSALIILFLAFALSVPAQRLLNVYKKGTVRLIPDVQYASGNDWDKVFKPYSDNKNIEIRNSQKSLLIMPDGSVVVSQPKRDYYVKFSPKGKFEKEFGIKNSKGEQLKDIKLISGIINNNTFFTGLDNIGRMDCFDFNGNFVKTMKFKDMTRQIISLPNRKFAMEALALGDKKNRDYVAIVDYDTKKEKVIWEYYTDRGQDNNASPDAGSHKLFSYSYKFKKGGGVFFNTMPFSNDFGLSAPPQIKCVGNNLVVAIPCTGEILVFDLSGNLKSKDKIGWGKNFLSVNEQREIQQKAIESYQTKKFKNPRNPDRVTAEEIQTAKESIISQMKADLAKITEPIPMSVFSTIIKDSDGNLLFFEYPKAEKVNKFNVWIYQNKGKFVCQSSFVCDDYDLEIKPSKMVFYKGYIYGLQHLKKAQSETLQLVRFKLQ